MSSSLLLLEANGLYDQYLELITNSTAPADLEHRGTPLGDLAPELQEYLLARLDRLIANLKSAPATQLFLD